MYIKVLSVKKNLKTLNYVQIRVLKLLFNQKINKMIDLRKKTTDLAQNIKKLKSEYKLLKSNDANFKRVQGYCIKTILNSRRFDAGNLSVKVLN